MVPTKKHLQKLLIFAGLIFPMWWIWQIRETLQMIITTVYTISIPGMLWLVYEGWRSKKFYQNRNEIG